jgi:hypothetical protein
LVTVRRCNHSWCLWGWALASTSVGSSMGTCDAVLTRSGHSRWFPELLAGHSFLDLVGHRMWSFFTVVYPTDTWQGID